EAFNHRVPGALSWLGRSDGLEKEKDNLYILLWIAFNALYAVDRDPTASTERNSFRRYFERLVQLDRSEMIQRAVWELYTEEIHRLLDNPYFFQPYWLHFNKVPGYQDWQQRFNRNRRAVANALRQRDT